MTIKEKLVAKIEKMPENKLPELYKIIEDFESDNETNALAKLRKIKISASPDLSTTATLYPYPSESNEK